MTERLYGRNAAQITPGNNPAFEERMFRCPQCGVMEAKIVEIK